MSDILTSEKKEAAIKTLRETDAKIAYSVDRERNIHLVYKRGKQLEEVVLTEMENFLFQSIADQSWKVIVELGKPSSLEIVLLTFVMGATLDRGEAKMNDKDSNSVEHAKRELDLILSDDEIDSLMKEDILAVLRLISTQGHSGFSIGVFANLLSNLILQKNTTPLTGEPGEWNRVEGNDDQLMYQNRRSSDVFKEIDIETGETRCFQLGRKIFKDPIGTTYTNPKSSMEVVFPYTAPKQTVVNVDYNGEEVDTPHTLASDISNILKVSPSELDKLKEMDISNISGNLRRDRDGIFAGVPENIEFIHVVGIFKDRNLEIGIFVSVEDPAIIGFEIYQPDRGSDSCEGEFWANDNFHTRPGGYTPPTSRCVKKCDSSEVEPEPCPGHAKACSSNAESNTQVDKEGTKPCQCQEPVRYGDNPSVASYIARD